MTMTTGMGIAATETIHNDIRPGANITLPNGQVLSEDAQILLDKSIVPKALGMSPAEGITVKNLAFRYRWVNRFGAGGAWFARRKSQGWQLATTSDAEPRSVEITSDNGELRLGDLVLMRIPVERYQQAMKAVMVKALVLQRDKRWLSNEKGELPSTDVYSEDQAVVHSATEGERTVGDGKYVKRFEPSTAELDAKMGKDKAEKK